MRTRSIVIILLALVILASALPLVATARQQPREVVLVARSMTFYQEGDEVANPVLRLRAGERIKIVLRNEDKGVLHGFTIQDLGIATDTLKFSESASVVFDVPAAPREYQYNCRPHSRMMAGTVTVE